jgi:hypothetical protein
MPARLKMLCCLLLSGCTLLSLEDLQSGSEPSVNGGGNVGGNGGNGAESSNGGATNNSGGNTGGGGQDPATLYANCIEADQPAVYFKLDASETSEPNLGSFVGDGSYKGESVLSPGLVFGTMDRPVAHKFINDGVLEFATAEFLGGYQPITIELWVQPGTLGDGEDVSVVEEGSLASKIKLFRKINPNDRTAEDQVSVHLATQTGERTAYLNSGNTDFFSDDPAPVFHIVAVYHQEASTIFDGSGAANDIEIWVNGVASTTPANGTKEPMLALTTLLIGGDLGDSASAPGRVIDEFAVYTQALSPERIAAHFHAGLTGICSP